MGRQGNLYRERASIAMVEIFLGRLSITEREREREREGCSESVRGGASPGGGCFSAETVEGANGGNERKIFRGK